MRLQRLCGQIFEDIDELTEREATNHISKREVEHRQSLEWSTLCHADPNLQTNE